MSMHTIYIEVSDEITTVIERLKKAPEDSVVLVVPKGAILLQSIVNLKLAKRAAEEVSKKMVLVSTDKTGRNLATQLGIPVATTEKDAEQALAGTLPAAETAAAEDAATVIAGVRIHRYYDEKGGETEEESAAPAQKPAADPIIIPKTMMQEQPTAPAAPVPEPEPLQRSVIDEPIPSAPVSDPVSPLSEEPPLETPVEPPSEPPVIPASLAAAALSKPPALPRNRKLLYFSLVLAGLLVIAVGAISFLFLPITQATLSVPAEAWTKDLDFTASTTLTAVSEDNKTVPAELLTGQASDKLSFKATGTKKVGDAAKGTARLFNSDSSDQQVLPSGSGLTANGRNFTTNAAAIVPGARVQGGKLVPGQVDVAITATEVGSESNLSDVSATVNVASPKLFGQIISTTGGSSKDVTIVSATDVANAKNSLTQRVKDACVANLNDQLKNRDPRSDEKADKFTFTDFTVSVAVGAEATDAEVTGKGTLKRLVADYPQIHTAVETRIMADASAAQKVLIEGADVNSFTVNADGTQATFTVHATGKNSAIIPMASLISGLAGRSEADGKALVNSTIANSTLTVTYKPSWWPVKRFPTFTKLLHLSVTYD